MQDAPGVGLAAPQIGVSLRVFTYDVDGVIGHLINPDLDLSEELQDGLEGCLSLPDLSFECTRAMHVVAKGMNMYGEPVVISGNHCYVSGHGPLRSDKTMITGVVGKDLNLEQGQAAARQVGLAILATLRNELGSLDRVKRLVKTLGMVNTAADFYDHPKVINGFSELMRDVFGDDAGVGARSAVGMGPLPGNIAVEVEAIFELHG